MKRAGKFLYACGRVLAVAVIALTTYDCARTTALFQRESEIPLSEHSALDYYLHIKSLPASGIDKMRLDLKQKSDMKPAVRLVQKAMLLSVPEDATAEQEQLALESLLQVINTPDENTDPLSADYKEFALLWRDVLWKRQELKGISGNLNTELTAERNKALSLQQEIQELIKKINALKSIEQNMDNRMQSLEPTNDR